MLKPDRTNQMIKIFSNQSESFGELELTIKNLMKLGLF